ncbi:MAG: phage tail protein [Rhizobiaceae bacterium]|nr:phage tail protein [Rhizobiaceae bacterium]
MTEDLLPDNRTILEEALAVATDPVPLASGTIESARGYRYARPLNASVAPWLVYEYGLGPISDYFATIEQLIDLGRAWQRIRGTPNALKTALGWIGYVAPVVEDQVTGRRRWHLYQIGMGALPGADESRRLADAEHLAGISDPARSEMFRGYHGYDVRAMVWGGKRFGDALLGDSSGVRINGGAVKWSHGRNHAVDVAGTVTDWAYFGWNDALADVVSASGTWSDTLSWDTPMLYWDGTTAEAIVKTWLLMQRKAHLVFRDGDGAAIGYARVIRAATDNAVAALAPSVIYQVRTGFGDGDENAAASVGVIYDLVTRDGVKPAKSWLTPSEVVPASGVDVGAGAFAHTFQRTVRETVTLTLTIS